MILNWVELSQVSQIHASAYKYLVDSLQCGTLHSVSYCFLASTKKDCPTLSVGPQVQLKLIFLFFFFVILSTSWQIHNQGFEKNHSWVGKCVLHIQLEELCELDDHVRSSCEWIWAFQVCSTSTTAFSWAKIGWEQLANGI
jgi:hypothetical protein